METSILSWIFSSPIFKALWNCCEYTNNYGQKIMLNIFFSILLQGLYIFYYLLIFFCVLLEERNPVSNIFSSCLQGQFPYFLNRIILNSFSKKILVFTYLVGFPGRTNSLALFSIHNFSYLFMTNFVLCWSYLAAFVLKWITV